MCAIVVTHNRYNTIHTKKTLKPSSIMSNLVFCVED